MCIYPFLIWSVIYNLFPWLTGVLGLDPKIILDFFPYSGEEVMQQSFSVAMQYILTIPFNFSLLAGAYVVYLPAYRALSIFARFLRMGGKAFAAG